MIRQRTKQPEDIPVHMIAKLYISQIRFKVYMKREICLRLTLVNIHYIMKISQLNKQLFWHLQADVFRLYNALCVSVCLWMAGIVEGRWLWN